MKKIRTGIVVAVVATTMLLPVATASAANTEVDVTPSSLFSRMRESVFVQRAESCELGRTDHPRTLHLAPQQILARIV